MVGPDARRALAAGGQSRRHFKTKYRRFLQSRRQSPVGSGTGSGSGMFDDFDDYIEDYMNPTFEDISGAADGNTKCISKDDYDGWMEPVVDYIAEEIVRSHAFLLACCHLPLESCTVPVIGAYCR